MNLSEFSDLMQALAILYLLATLWIHLLGHRR